VEQVHQELQELQVEQVHRELQVHQVLQEQAEQVG
jgi:hypothetical protein